MQEGSAAGWPIRTPLGAVATTLGIAALPAMETRVGRAHDLMETGPTLS
jgi:hypothetical protein